MSRVYQLRRNRRGFLMPSVMTLALLRLRKTWFLLFITSLGMLAAVIITCAIPLFSDVMTTAGLRDTLNATPASAEIPISASTLGLSTSLVNDVHKKLEEPVRQQFGSLAQQTRFSISSYNISFVHPPHLKSVLTTYSITTQDIATHLEQLQGRGVKITNTPTSDIEVLLSSATARQLSVTVGSTFTVTMSYALQPSNFNAGPQPAQYTRLLVAHVVGIFNVIALTFVMPHLTQAKSQLNKRQFIHTQWSRQTMPCLLSTMVYAKICIQTLSFPLQTAIMDCSGRIVSTPRRFLYRT